MKVGIVGLGNFGGLIAHPYAKDARAHLVKNFKLIDKELEA
jgi:prephenate dehydrogenase